MRLLPIALCAALAAPAAFAAPAYWTDWTSEMFLASGVTGSINAGADTVGVTFTGLYSFAAPLFAVYVVLGEDDGRPNLVITVRGSASDPASPEPTLPHNGSSLSPRATVSPEASGSPADGTASASPTDTTDSTRSATPRAS